MLRPNSRCKTHLFDKLNFTESVCKPASNTVLPLCQIKTVLAYFSWVNSRRYKQSDTPTVVQGRGFMDPGFLLCY